MQKQFFGAKREILLEANFDIDRVVLLLPRMSANAHGDSYSGLVKVAEDAGYACARLKLWEDMEEAAEHSYEAAFAKIDAAVATLQSLGFIDVALVGHSFGGGIAALYQHDLVSQKILWAPSLSVGETSTFAAHKATPIGELRSPLDVVVTKDDVAAEHISAILHGTRDTVVPAENSEALARELGVTYTEIEGADHAFSDSYHKDMLLAATEDLLQ